MYSVGFIKDSLRTIIAMIKKQDEEILAIKQHLGLDEVKEELVESKSKKTK